MSNTSGHFTPESAAVYISSEDDPLAVKTLAIWRSQGRGPTYLKVGNRILYAKADLDAWLQTCRRTSTAQQAGR